MKKHILTIITLIMLLAVGSIVAILAYNVSSPTPETIQGIQGIAGEVGSKGEKGDRGIQGEKGDTWYNDLPKLYKQTSPAVVWIGAERNLDDYSSQYHQWVKEDIVKWQGTGFLVSEDGLIATAGHVCKDTQFFEIQFQDGTRGKAKFVHMEDIGRCDVGFLQIIWIDKHWDDDEIHIQIMESESIENLPYLNLDVEIEIGESLIILGYPWGLNTEISITSGIVAAPKHDWYPYLKLSLFADVASYPGNSGSPVINMDGEVIGILVGGPHENESYSMCTPARLAELAMQKALAEIGLREAK